LRLFRDTNAFDPFISGHVDPGTGWPITVEAARVYRAMDWACPLFLWYRLLLDSNDPCDGTRIAKKGSKPLSKVQHSSSEDDRSVGDEVWAVYASLDENSVPGLT
jgi:hypothetical protein